MIRTSGCEAFSPVQPLAVLKEANEQEISRFCHL